MSRSGRVGWRGPKTYVGQHLAPNQRSFALTDGKCSGRHAGHDPGVENTRIGPKRPYLPRFVFVYILGRFSSPHMSNEKRPTTKVNNRIRPPETNVARRQGRLAQPEDVIWPSFGPIKRIFDLTDAFFFPAASRTRFGRSKIPASAPNGPFFSHI